MMIINKEYLKILKPCKDRYKNYLEHYKDWEGSLEQFIDLSELTYYDKKWVFFRSIPKDKLRLMAAEFAERVLHIYESQYPNDDRPRKAIKAVKNSNTAAYAAAAYAAYAAYVAAHVAYADAAAYAAYAAYVAAYAADAADAADAAAAHAAYAAGAADAAEENAQIEIMKKYAREALKGGK